MWGTRQTPRAGFALYLAKKRRRFKRQKRFKYLLLSGFLKFGRLSPLFYEDDQIFQLIELRMPMA
jgi:hypothetical protein